MKSEYIAGEKLYYDGDFHKVLLYLNHDLRHDEARVFFIVAREKGEAPFKMNHDGHYVIRYEHGKYFLEKQQ